MHMARKERRYAYEAVEPNIAIPPLQMDGKKKKIAILLVIAAVAIIIMSIFGLWALNTKKQQDRVEIVLPNATIMNATTEIPKCYDDDCFLRVALATLSVDACDQILDEPKRTGCYEKLSDDVLGACLKVSNSTIKNNCLTIHALNEKSLSLCKSLDDETREKQCIEGVDPCYYKNGTSKLFCLAIANEDYTQCNKDEACIIQYNRVNKDINACNELTLPQSKNACISIINGNDNICSDLGNQITRDTCRLKYVTETHDVDACTRITNDTYYSQECYTDIAINKIDATYCNFLPAIEFRWNCLINYTKVINDANTCNMIPTYVPKAYSNCWFTYATSNFEPLGCTYVANPTYKKSCYERIFSLMNLASQWRNVR